MSFDLSNIMLVVAIGGVAFSIYRSYREPDVQADKEIALLGQKLDFVIQKVTNDLPHIDSQIKDIHTDLADSRQQIVKLQVIIEERLPRREK